MAWDSEGLLVLVGPGQAKSDCELEDVAGLLNIPDEALPVSKFDLIFGEVLDNQVLAEWQRMTGHRFENDAARILQRGDTEATLQRWKEDVRLLNHFCRCASEAQDSADRRIEDEIGVIRRHSGVIRKDETLSEALIRLEKKLRADDSFWKPAPFDVLAKAVGGAYRLELALVKDSLACIIHEEERRSKLQTLKQKARRVQALYEYRWEILRAARRRYEATGEMPHLTEAEPAIQPAKTETETYGKRIPSGRMIQRARNAFQLLSSRTAEIPGKNELNAELAILENREAADLVKQLDTTIGYYKKGVTGNTERLRLICTFLEKHDPAFLQEQEKKERGEEI